jgi:hypothetical protein
MRITLDQLHRCHQHAGRANAALRAAAIEKRLLYRMQLAVRCEPFNSLNLGALRLPHGHKATVDQLAVHAH